MFLPPLCSGWRDAGDFPVHAHHGPASLLMPILAVRRQNGQNGKCGKKNDKNESTLKFGHFCVDNG
jgi:hypothetical protein